jgi:glycogen operon protein
MGNLNIEALDVTPGRPYPMGPVVTDGGVRFTIFSRHATRVWLALYEGPHDQYPVWEYELDRLRHRTGDIWSVFVHNLGVGAYYMYRMDGPYDPVHGHRFDPECYVLDPYAKSLVGDIHNNTMKCVAIEDEMDWHDDMRPHRRPEELIIYETHVRGLTVHNSSGVKDKGTYAGLIEKIPYLKDLGITAIEILPIATCGEDLLGRRNPLSGEELTNYWGYSNIGFFSPTPRYACSALNREHVDEFRRMVEALHKADLEIILDVVFNHTSEGNEKGPTICFRGIDNSIYYMLGEKGDYINYSGCGNTVNCNHPLVRDFILDCLRYWVAVMHIDGFRFDLASILGRDMRGNILPNAPLIERIAQDPVLRDCKLIAEAWDAGGAYQVGSFGDIRWAEWNGKYRDDIRRFWRGDSYTRPSFATRLTGSSDLYQAGGRNPYHSINFVTCHDGFTLRDLVSYNHKRNWANGEHNRDGSNDNFSTNCGFEGETDDAEINALRLRMQKNFLATLFLSLGTPMILGGDEFGRTQSGNNNAYCQDNMVSWVDWSLAEQNAELLRFCKGVIAFRKQHPVFQRTRYFTGRRLHDDHREADIEWFDERGRTPEWHAARTPLACRISGFENNGHPLYLAFNNTNRPVSFRLPNEEWQAIINTGRPSPYDYVTDESPAPHGVGRRMLLARKSLAVLVGPRG